MLRLPCENTLHTINREIANWREQPSEGPSVGKSARSQPTHAELKQGLTTSVTLCAVVRGISSSTATFRGGLSIEGRCSFIPKLCWAGEVGGWPFTSQQPTKVGPSSGEESPESAEVASMKSVRTESHT
jgi:hypothetical protein